jgi:hypothetical protein
MTEWMDDGACQQPGMNPEWWWESYVLATHICRRHCDVRTKCDAWAPGQDLTGAVVGGYLRSDAKGTRANRQPTPHRAGCPTCAPNTAPSRTGKSGPTTDGIVECPRCHRPTARYTDGRLAGHNSAPGWRCG